MTTIGAWWHFTDTAMFCIPPISYKKMFRPSFDFISASQRCVDKNIIPIHHDAAFAI
jgi:hypothetical protein